MATVNTSLLKLAEVMDESAKRLDEWLPLLAGDVRGWITAIRDEAYAPLAEYEMQILTGTTPSCNAVRAMWNAFHRPVNDPNISISLAYESLRIKEDDPEEIDQDAIQALAKIVLAGDLDVRINRYFTKIKDGFVYCFKQGLAFEHNLVFTFHEEKGQYRVVLGHSVMSLIEDHPVSVKKPTWSWLKHYVFDPMFEQNGLVD